MLQVTTQWWNVGAQQRQHVCTTLSAIFLFFLHSFSLHLFVSQKSLNDEKRGGNCLLVPERCYGPDSCTRQCIKVTFWWMLYV